MTKAEQDQIRALVYHHQQSKGKKQRQILRDELYFRMQPYLIKWIKSILRKWRIYLSDQEILSLSYHCYLHALDKYNKRVPIPFHFYTYSMYFLYKEFVNKKEIRMENREMTQINPNCGIERLFEYLPHTCKQILEDILMQRSTIKTKGSYYDHKRIIKQLLRKLIG